MPGGLRLLPPPGAAVFNAELLPSVLSMRADSSSSFSSRAAPFLAPVSAVGWTAAFALAPSTGGTGLEGGRLPALGGLVGAAEIFRGGGGGSFLAGTFPPSWSSSSSSRSSMASLLATDACEETVLSPRGVSCSSGMVSGCCAQKALHLSLASSSAPSHSGSLPSVLGAAATFLTSSTSRCGRTSSKTFNVAARHASSRFRFGLKLAGSFVPLSS
mmetsp:Transcript_11729/g.27062  ORF Transcript_11729/g.27062 Transcript_11729/m.27062 type:complete len:215 (-) Transcript_11729:413-1057(-)